MTPEDEARVRELIAESVKPTDGDSVIHQSQIPPRTIKKRHIQDVVIVFGLATDRPTDSSTRTFCYFATDTDTLSCYNGNAWVEEVLT